TMIAHNIPVIFHPILDGRDTPPQSAEKYLVSLIDYCTQNATATIGTMAGRFYTMDRDNRWERIEKSYNVLVEPQHSRNAAITPIQILEESYSKGIYDEFVLPS